MASQFGLQTGNQYFPQPVRSDISRNLLAGAESAQRLMQLKAQEDRTKIYEDQVRQQQEQADIAKATKIFEAKAPYIEVNPDDPVKSAENLKKAGMELEAEMKTAFPNGIPSTITPHLESLKSGSPDVVQGFYNYQRNKLKIPQTPEELGDIEYQKRININQANQDVPPHAKDTGPSDLKTWMTERDALPEGHPDRATYENWIKMKSTRQAQRDPAPYYQYVGMDDAGNPRIFDARTGGMASKEVAGGMNPKPTNVTEGEQKSAANFNNLATEMQVVKDLFDPAYIGPIAGRVQKKAGEYVNLPGGEKQQRFYVGLDSLGNILLYLRSGAQINENEYKRLKKELPDAKFPYEKFVANYNNFLDILTDTLMVKGQSLKRRGVDPVTLIKSLPPKMGEEGKVQTVAAPQPKFSILGVE